MSVWILKSIKSCNFSFQIEVECRNKTKNKHENKKITKHVNRFMALKFHYVLQPIFVISRLALFKSLWSHYRVKNLGKVFGGLDVFENRILDFIIFDASSMWMV